MGATVGSRRLRLPTAPVHGTMFVPSHLFPSLGVLVIGGSGGSEPSYVAAALAAEGFAALSVAYFGRRGLPRSLSRIPIEYFVTATRILQGEVAPRLPMAVIGMSRGSEAAMLTALWAGGAVRGVVVSVPGNVIAGGLPSGGPAWMLDGRPLPYVEHSGPLSEDPDAYIAVEQVPGPVLLVSAGEDAVWPSAEMAGAISDRLRTHGDAYRHVLLEYPHAGHTLGYLLPRLPPGVLHSDLRDDPPTRSARADAWPKMVDFLRGLA
ncbi:MAG: acyl-CoA thioester hydrolase/BAAT C-terminal domain-containing protein [Candidatus Dormibacteria bacterium]